MGEVTMQKIRDHRTAARDAALSGQAKSYEDVALNKIYGGTLMLKEINPRELSDMGVLDVELALQRMSDYYEQLKKAGRVKEL